MMKLRIIPFVLLVVTAATPAAVLAQERLTLDEAVARARSGHPSARAGSLAERDFDVARLNHPRTRPSSAA